MALIVKLMELYIYQDAFPTTRPQVNVTRIRSKDVLKSYYSVDPMIWDPIKLLLGS